jgi:hypothetical protein
MDSHNCKRVVVDGHPRNEGDVQAPTPAPYPVSYRAIVPRRGECENLLVPVCLSSSHTAYGSIRMEPVFMVLGQSAATAAALAIDARAGVQAVDYAKLRERLLRDKQVLDWTGPKRPGAIDPKKLPGVVVDDPAAEREGFAGVSSVIGPFVGEGYRHDGGTKDGKQWAKFRPDLPRAGKYEVRLSYTANPNRATKVPVKVVHAGGEVVVGVNQRKAPPLDGAWVSLGTFRFAAGTKGYIEVGNAGADGHVVIDAAQWLPVPD